jgi:hypothetical protein
MNPRTEARLEKVKRTSRGARRVCLLLMWLVSLTTAVMAVSTLTLPQAMTCDFGGLRQPCSELPPQVVALTFVSLVGGLALVLLALYRLARLFQNYAHGEIFTRGSVRELRLVGYVAVAYALLQFVLFIAALALAAGGTIESPANLRVDFPIGPAIVAGLVLLLSWIMDVGAEIHEENELTV